MGFMQELVEEKINRPFRTIELTLSTEVLSNQYHKQMM